MHQSKAIIRCQILLLVGVDSIIRNILWISLHLELYQSTNEGTKMETSIPVIILMKENCRRRRRRHSVANIENEKIVM